MFRIEGMGDIPFYLEERQPLRQHAYDARAWGVHDKRGHSSGAEIQDCRIFVVLHRGYR